MNDKRKDQPSQIGGLLAAIMASLRGVSSPVARRGIVRPAARHGRCSRRPARVGRFVRLCPRCDRPLRRTDAHGVRTDRYFDKDAGETICTVCAERGNRQ